MFKKSKPAPKRFMEEVSDVAEKISTSVRKGSATAIEQTGPYLEKANALVHDATEAAAPKLRNASERLQAAAEQVREQAAPRLNELSKQGKARAHDLRTKVTEQSAKYGQDAAGRIADGSNRAAGLLASASVPAGVEKALVKVTGDKKVVKKAQKAAAKRAKELAAEAKKAQKVAAKRNKSGLSWIVWVLALGALGGIAYFVWKKAQPVEDPWSTPLPGNRPADARPVGSHDTEGGVAPVVSEVEVPADKANEVDKDADIEVAMVTDKIDNSRN